MGCETVLCSAADKVKVLDILFKAVLGDSTYEAAEEGVVGS